MHNLTKRYNKQRIRTIYWPNVAVFCLNSTRRTRPDFVGDPRCLVWFGACPSSGI